MKGKIKILETPRDAIQSSPYLIDWKKKERELFEYLEMLLGVGFDFVDVGSFVSYKAVPSMAYTPHFLEHLDDTTPEYSTRIVVLVASASRCEKALSFSSPDIIAYPFSVSETFMQRNLRKSREEGLQEIKVIYEMVRATGREFLVYMSMAFGNPYQEEYSAEMVTYWTGKILEIAPEAMVSLADTTSMATPAIIRNVITNFKKTFPDVEPGLHLHVEPSSWREKVSAALYAGCTWFDTAMGGYGGCPFTGSKLVGNLPTEVMVSYMQETHMPISLDMELMNKALHFAREKIFS